MTTNGPDTLAAYYQSLALIEDKLADVDLELGKLSFDTASKRALRAGYVKDRRELHRLIAAKKKRPAKDVSNG